MEECVGPNDEVLGSSPNKGANKMKKKDLVLLITVLPLVVIAFALLINPYLVLKRECFKVTQTLGCGGDTCRIVLDNGKSGYTYGPALVGDTVCENLKYKNIYNVVFDK